MKTIKGFKFVGKDMESLNGNHKWVLNKWYKESNIKLCGNGFHACIEPLESLSYVYGDRYFIVEAKGKIIKEKGDKFVASEMRLIKELPINEIFKPFAIWCAKQCLNIYEKNYPEDKRVSNCIKASEDYLNGKISLDELMSAHSAAESAAWSVAGSAAKSAVESSWSARSAAKSAVESAWSVASRGKSAGRSAAKSAAWSVESAGLARSAGLVKSAKSAQNEKLKELNKVKQNG